MKRMERVFLVLNLTTVTPFQIVSVSAVSAIV